MTGGLIIPDPEPPVSPLLQAARSRFSSAIYGGFNHQLVTLGALLAINEITTAIVQDVTYRCMTHEGRAQYFRTIIRRKLGMEAPAE
jgi:hypothetical protein